MENSKTLTGQAFWGFWIENACGKVGGMIFFDFFEIFVKAAASQKTDEITFRNEMKRY